MTALRAFLVEDSPLILENLSATLQELASVEVVGSAATEADARRWLGEREGDVELLIIDIFLRQGSGLGVLQTAAQAAPAARRVVLTNYASAEVRARCRALGADRVFDKSGELDELIGYCQRLAAGRPKAGGA
jgi:DNA-binding NarL/FixJ family response regulator